MKDSANVSRSEEMYEINIFSEKVEDIVACSNSECPHSRWYHISCVELTSRPEIYEDWWCCEACEDNKTSVLCLCKIIKDDMMVKCSNSSNCVGGIMFHKGCVNFDKDNVTGRFKVAHEYKTQLAK